MIVKAKVVTNSANDPEGKGRVKIEAPALWENASESEDYIPVNNNIPLNEGDIVYVYIYDMDFANPFILGRCRDNSWRTNGSDPEGFSTLWESVVLVNESTVKWAVAYVKGDSLIYENSEKVIFDITGSVIKLTTPSVSMTVDVNGLIQVNSDSTISFNADGKSSPQPVPFGDTLLSELKKLSDRVDSVVDAVGSMLSAGKTAPNDGGTTLKTTMTAYWESKQASLKWGKSPNETWDSVLNGSVTTSGTPK